MKRLLVIGGASFDLLHFEDRTIKCPGGAGLYAALAAQRCGAQTSMFAPRPDPCPEALQPAAERLAAWLGPVVSPEELPHFEIAYRQGVTEYLAMSLGAEPLLDPTDLPADLSEYDHVHVTPLGEAGQQLAFVQACRQRGARRLSAGTGLFIAKTQPALVRAVMALCDQFFLNRQEAISLFGSLEAAGTAVGKLLYVTLGAEGVRVIQGETATTIPAVATQEVDPTGAGESFCGATLAFLLDGAHPLMAARRAAVLAAEMITQVGPAALLSTTPAPAAPLDERVVINAQQVARVAATIATLPEAVPFPFTGDVFPPAGHPQALDYFFAATVQQFSFWSERAGQYDQPLLARIGGVTRKGSDFLWAAYRRQLAADPTSCAPERQANLGREEMRRLFRADDGSEPMPAPALHLAEARRYGRDMLALRLTPGTLLAQALASPEPLQRFLTLLDAVGGYQEDPLRKKSGLLALILNQRPERFLPLRDDEEVAPVIDYHLMRSCLRIGLIDVLDEALRQRLAARQLVSAGEEWAIRHAGYQAVAQVTALSGKSTGAVDWFFFSARRRCPEMSAPECSLCPVDAVCTQRKELFQPVLRTSFY